MLIQVSKPALLQTQIARSVNANRLQCTSDERGPQAVTGVVFNNQKHGDLGLTTGTLYMSSQHVAAGLNSIAVVHMKHALL